MESQREKVGNKAYIPLDISFALGTQRDQKQDKQHEIYMANASPSCWGPNATYIPPACVRGNANFSIRVGGNANFSIFRYQTVGIPNAKFLRWGYCPTRTPNARGFALQWNIGLTVLFPYSLQCRPVSLPCSLSCYAATMGVLHNMDQGCEFLY